MNSAGFLALLEKARSGDQTAIEQVLRTFRPHLMRLAGDFSDRKDPSLSASDLVQDACLRAWNKLDTFTGANSDEAAFAAFRSWISEILRRVAMNARRDRARKRRRPPNGIVPIASSPNTTSSTPAAPEPAALDRSPSSIVRRDELSLVLTSALEKIPDPKDAEIVRMIMSGGLTLAEVSRRLGMDYENVRYRFHSTLRRLQAALTPWL